MESLGKAAKIRVVGIGGAGTNAVNGMIEKNDVMAEFYVMNTDLQALSQSNAENKLQIGPEITQGLGAGSDPALGAAAAEESIEDIRDICEGVKLLFIAAGMGGGTGTGAAPVVARVAKECGCLTVAVVTKPFVFEGKKRALNAEEGIKKLKQYVDMLIIVPNAKLLEMLPAKTPMTAALKVADEHLYQSVCSIVDLIETPSIINLDFTDIRTIMSDQGIAHIGRGVAEGDDRVIEAVRAAVSNPLLETTIEGARKVITYLVGGDDFSLADVEEASELVRNAVDENAEIIFGMDTNPKYNGKMIVTVIATGLEGEPKNSPSAEVSPRQTLDSLIKPAPAEQKEEVEEPVIRSEAENEYSDPELPPFVRFNASRHNNEG